MKERKLAHVVYVPRGQKCPVSLRYIGVGEDVHPIEATYQAWKLGERHPSLKGQFFIESADPKEKATVPLEAEGFDPRDPDHRMDYSPKPPYIPSSQRNP